eukprot:gene9665-10651_t
MEERWSIIKLVVTHSLNFPSKHYNVFLGDAHNTSFPRTDPVVISVVTSKDDKEILLGRKKQFPANMYSCLAGFVEPGESIEEAVRREVKEESGVHIDNVVYVSSQPWPYPSVLMIGCISRATSRTITVCTDELEDAKWFTYQDIQSALEESANVEHKPPLCIPPSQTIAHQLIKRWAHSKANTEYPAD